MKKLLALLMLMLPLIVSAQQNAVRLITKDSLRANLNKGWRFADADRPELALAAFDDHLLPRINPETLVTSDSTIHFKGIGWMRLRFRTDSSLLHRILAIEVKQSGASEVFLDGKKLVAYGYINGKDSSEYIDPQSLPHTFTIDTPGEHLLAVRYANWGAIADDPQRQRSSPGFRMSLESAGNAIENHQSQMVGIAAFMMMLMGLFGALFLLHLLFFLYNRSDKSNLLFSLFSLSLAALFLTAFLLKALSNPASLHIASKLSFVLIILSFFSLSGFLNMLFAKKRLRFGIITVCCAIVLGVYFFDHDYGLIAMGGIIAIVAVEAIVLIFGAIIRRKPGARIIGAGLLLLVIMLLIVLSMAVTSSYVYLDDSKPGGQLLVILVMLSILSIPVSLSAYLARNFAFVSKSLKLQLAAVQALSQKTMEQEAEKQRLLQSRQQELEKEVAAATAEVRQQHDELKIEKKKTDDLLLNILPEEVAEELKQSGESAARLYENVTVLFTDFVDFTQHSEKLSPAALVAEIHECFKAFDGITGQYGLEKIKTVGDAYIAVAGLPVSDAHHARQVVSAGIAIRDFMVQRKKTLPGTFDIRLGIHSGPVVAGIVGVKKFAYDIWGDTVNTAARMEQASEAGRINISAATCALVKDDFDCSFRGDIEAKHKGKLGMYYVELKG